MKAFYIDVLIINSLILSQKSILIKLHDEYVKYLNQTIKDSEEKDFDKMIKIMNKAIENLPKNVKNIFTK